MACVLVACGSVIASAPSAVNMAPAPNVARAETIARSLPRVDGTDVFPAARRSATYVASPDAVEVGATTSVKVTVRNFGDGVWEASGSRAVSLSYHLYDPSGALITWDGLRTPLAADVASGGSAVVDMAFAAPLLTGIYTVRPDLVRDGSTGWLSNDGSAAGAFSLKV